MFPIHLSDYFAPLNFSLVIRIVFIWLIWDVSGSFYANRVLSLPSWTRVSWWMIGLGQSIFVLFILNLFYPLSSRISLISVVLPAVPFIMGYLRDKNLHILLLELKRLALPLLLFCPLIGFLFAKASLPPYQFDEMAYHYLSPFDLANAAPWSFSGGIYQVIPRNLNLLFHLLFSIFKTYSVARLTHFVLFISALLIVYSWLKLRFGILSAVIFWLFVFYTPGQNWVYPSTSGYIDIGTASFVLIGIILAIENVVWGNRDQIHGSLVYFSLALGSKYTSILPSVSYLLPSIARSLKTINRKLLLYTLFVAISVGLFWYLKNIYFAHNPIYPFLFGCQPADCVGGAGLFEGWTTKVVPANFHTILTDLLGGNTKVLSIFAFAVILSVFARPSNLLLTSFMIFSCTAIEFIMMKYFSGFYLRYFFHLRFIALILIASQASLKIRGHIIFRYLRVIFIGFVIVFLMRNIPRQIRYYYRNDLTPIELNYALNKIDIHAWVKHLHPKTRVAVDWCDKRSELTVLNTADPDLIWFDFEGMSRIFMTNCQIKIYDPADSKRLSFQAKDYYFTITNCRMQDDIKMLGYENSQQKRLRIINNDIVCQLNVVNEVVYKSK